METVDATLNVRVTPASNNARMMTISRSATPTRSGRVQQAQQPLPLVSNLVELQPMQPIIYVSSSPMPDASPKSEQGRVESLSSPSAAVDDISSPTHVESHIRDLESSDMRVVKSQRRSMESSSEYRSLAITTPVPSSTMSHHHLLTPALAAGLTVNIEPSPPTHSRRAIVTKLETNATPVSPAVPSIPLPIQPTHPAVHFAATTTEYGTHRIERADSVDELIAMEMAGIGSVPPSAPASSMHYSGGGEPAISDSAETISLAAPDCSPRPFKEASMWSCWLPSMAKPIASESLKNDTVELPSFPESTPRSRSPSQPCTWRTRCTPMYHTFLGVRVIGWIVLCCFIVALAVQGYYIFREFDDVINTLRDARFQAGCFDRTKVFAADLSTMLKRQNAIANAVGIDIMGTTNVVTQSMMLTKSVHTHMCAYFMRYGIESLTLLLFILSASSRAFYLISAILCSVVCNTVSWCLLPTVTHTSLCTTLRFSHGIQPRDHSYQLLTRRPSEEDFSFRCTYMCSRVC